MSRLGRSQPVQPFAAHGFVDPGPGPVGTVPPRVTVVENNDRRRHTPSLPAVLLSGPVPAVTPPTVAPPPPVVSTRFDRPRVVLDPVATSAALRSVVAAPPPVLPSGPFVVPLEERRRFLAALPATVIHGLDIAAAAPTPVPPPTQGASAEGMFTSPLEARYMRDYRASLADEDALVAFLIALLA